MRKMRTVKISKTLQNSFISQLFAEMESYLYLNAFSNFILT